MSGPLTGQAIGRKVRRFNKKLRRLQVRPKYDRTLLPEGYNVGYKLFNIGGARRIVIAGVVDATGKTLSTGHAICSPADEYIEERGMLIAEGRAIKSWHYLNSVQFKMDQIVINALKGNTDAIAQTKS